MPHLSTEEQLGECRNSYKTIMVLRAMDSMAYLTDTFANFESPKFASNVALTESIASDGCNNILVNVALDDSNEPSGRTLSIDPTTGEN